MMLVANQSTITKFLFAYTMPGRTIETAELKTPSAHSFTKTRADHASECAADYVELIQDLIEETGEARAVDLAARLGVSHVTVSKTLQRLAREDLVTYRPYRSIFLTRTGADLADSMRKRHRLVLGLLSALGVPDDVALQDAEGMEHHASQTTLDAIEAFLAFRSAAPTSR